MEEIKSTFWILWGLVKYYVYMNLTHSRRTSYGGGHHTFHVPHSPDETGWQETVKEP